MRHFRTGVRKWPVCGCRCVLTGYLRSNSSNLDGSSRPVSFRRVTPRAAASGHVCLPDWALGLDREQLDNSLSWDLWPEPLCSAWHLIYLQLITALSEWSPLWKWQCSPCWWEWVQGRPSALVSRLSSFLSPPLGVDDNFRRVASLLGNKNKLNQCHPRNSLRVSRDGILMGWLNPGVLIPLVSLKVTSKQKELTLQKLNTWVYQKWEFVATSSLPRRLRLVVCDSRQDFIG